MVQYHAAYYKQESGWYVVEVLDFPGVMSQGKTLRSARRMIRDALRMMVEWYIEDGLALPRPNRRIKSKGADFSEAIPLRVNTGAVT